MGKKTFYFLLFALVFCSVSVLGADSFFCYQESANETNQSSKDGVCGLNYTGIYNMTDATCTAPNSVWLTTDGLWNTGCYNDTNIGQMYFNYTKPTYTILGAVWDAFGQVAGNATIPAECYTGSSIKLKFDDTGPNQRFYCLDQTSGTYALILTGSGRSSMNEEGIRWNVTSPPPPAPDVSKINITYPPSDGQVFNSSFTLNGTINENVSNIDYGYYTFNGVDYFDIQVNFTNINNSCYQESSDVDNQTGKDGHCGLDYSGTYNLDAVSCSSGNPANMHDGNWTTYCYKNNFGSYYVNYTIPTYALAAIWDVKAQSEYNFTIPQSCMASLLQLWFVDWSPYNWQTAFCFNYWGSGGFVSIGSNPGYSTFFEEGVRWFTQQDSFDFSIDLIPRSGENNITIFLYYLNGSSINMSRSFNLTPNVTYNYSDNIISRQYGNFSFVVQKPDVSLSKDNFSVVFKYNNSVISPLYTYDYLDNVTYLYTALTPNITSTTTIGFSWNVSILGGTNYTYFANHTVTSIALLNCSAGFTPVVNVSVFYESMYPLLLTSDFRYVAYVYFNNDYSNPYVVNSAWNDSTSFAICINTSGVNYTYDLYAQYYADGGFNERIYLYKQNGNTTLYMYAGNYNGTTETLVLNLNVKDNSYLTYRNIVGHLERYYISEDTWRIVQWDKSDEYGRMIFNVREKDTDYRLKFYDTSNNLLKSTDVMKFYCVGGYCDLVQIISPTSTTTANNLSIINSYNNVSQVVTTSWTDVSNLTSSLRIYVTKETFQHSIIICNTTGTGSSGLVVCDTSAYNGTIGVRVYSTASPERAVYTYFFNKVEQSLMNILGTKEGSFWGGMFMVAIASFGVVVSPVVGMVLAIFGLIILSFLGMVTFISTTMIILVIIVAVVLAIKVKV